MSRAEIPPHCTPAALARLVGLPVPADGADLPTEVSCPELGRVLGLSGRRVRDLVAEGRLPRGPGGGVDLAAVAAAGMAALHGRR